MKRMIKALALSLMLIMALPVQCFASEGVVTTETGEEYVSKAPWVYGEMENGLFVRPDIFYDELSWISIDDPDYRYEDALATQSRAGFDGLTPEMEADGHYMYYEGYIMYLSENSGERSEDEVRKERQEEELSELTTPKYDEDGNPIVDYGYGYVTFVSTVESGIHQTLFVEVTNTSSSKVYLFELFETNSYNKSVQLPEGTYIISDGGIASDFTNEYPISEGSFTVTAGGVVSVPFTIGDVDAEAVENGITINLNESDPVEDTEPVVNEPVKNDTNFGGIVVRILLIAAAIGIGAVLIFKKKK